MTQAVTLFALLELYKSGELVWRQSETFGPIEIMRRQSRVNPIARQLTALLFCSPEPVSRAELARRSGAPSARARRRARGGARAVRAEGSRASCCARSPAAARSPPTRRPTTPCGGCCRSRARRRSRRRRPSASRSRPTCSRSRGPEIARIRGVNSDSAMSTLEERGLIEECGRIAVRRDPLPHDAAVREAVRPRGPRRAARPRAFEPSAEDEQQLRDKLLQAGEQRVS